MPMPAARITDPHVCPMVTVLVPARRRTHRGAVLADGVDWRPARGADHRYARVCARATRA